MRYKADIRVDQKMRLQEVAAICIDRSVAIDEFELRDRIIHAVNDDLKSAVTIDETVLFHVNLDYGTQVVEANMPLRPSTQKAASRTAREPMRKAA